MTQTSPRSSKPKKSKHKKNKPSLHQPSVNHQHGNHGQHAKDIAIEDIDTATLSSLVKTSIEQIDTIKTARTSKRDTVPITHATKTKISELPNDPDDTLPALKAVTTAKSAKKLSADASPFAEKVTLDTLDTQPVPSQHTPGENTTSLEERASPETQPHQELSRSVAASAQHMPLLIEQQPTQIEVAIRSKPAPSALFTPSTSPTLPTIPTRVAPQQLTSRGGVLLFIGLLIIVVFHTLSIGQESFVGGHGWAYVLGGPSTSGDPNLLKNITTHLQPTPGAKAKTPLTPAQYIHLIVNGMSLDQKLGQMMIVQFVGPSYSLELSTMISQYNVGAVLIFYANQNIHDKTQLKDLIQQMQANSTVPMAVAIDQEGGYVDRLATLDGPRPSEAQIGASGDPNIARAAGLQDAQNLTSYGINLNLAPVVDVTNVYNPQLATRTYGNNADLVTKMASAYLQGLQKSGKVLGTLKHFPGLGDVAVDPHIGVPRLTRSLDNLNSIDWAPYRTLIQQGNIHAIMVTHELVTSVDASIPSSLSHKVVTGILRQQLGFQGVIMTDSLTMEGILAYASESQAAALAVEAGADLLMGASTPSDVASMIDGIKRAISNGDISQQQIDDSVQRILTMKYAMGLLPLPQ